MNKTKPKIVLDVETTLRVELDFMNNTHFEEIEMVNKLGDLINHYQETETPTESQKNQLSESLQEWLDHTVAHFERENKLMRETGFLLIRYILMNMKLHWLICEMFLMHGKTLETWDDYPIMFLSSGQIGL